MITQGQGYTINDAGDVVYDDENPSERTRELAAAAITRHREKASKVDDVSVDDVQSALEADREAAAARATTTTQED